MRFTSAETALRWAYEVAARPIMAQTALRDCAHAAEDRLDVHELYAQAIAILRLTEITLTPIQLAYVQAQFGREAQGVIDLIRLLCETYWYSEYSRRSIEKIVRAYCGEKIGLREIRRSLACGMLKAVSLRNSVYDALDVIHDQAMARMLKALDDRGLIYQEMSAKCNKI